MEEQELPKAQWTPSYSNKPFTINPEQLGRYKDLKLDSSGLNRVLSGDSTFEQDASLTQTIGDRILSSAKIAGSNFLATGLGLLATIPDMVISGEFVPTNPKLSGALFDWRDEIQKENTPFETYYDKENPFKSILLPGFLTGSSKGWGTIGETLSYGLGATAGVLAEEAIVSALTLGSGTIPTLSANIARLAMKATPRVAKYIEEGYSAYKGLNTLEDFGDVARGLQKQENLTQAISAGLTTTRDGIRAFSQAYSESMFEALEGKSNYIENQKQKFKETFGYEPIGEELKQITQDADKVFKTRFYGNLGVLSATNLLSNKFIFDDIDNLKGYAKNLGLKASYKNGVLDIADDTFKLATEAKWWDKGFGKGLKKGIEGTVNIAKSTPLALSEGVEEGLQFIIDKASQNYFAHDYNDKENAKQISALDSIINAAGDLFTSTEGQQSMLLGVLSGTGQQMLFKATSGIGDKVAGSLDKDYKSIKQRREEAKKQAVTELKSLESYSKDIALQAANVNSAFGTLDEKVVNFLRASQISETLDKNYDNVTKQGLMDMGSFNTLAPYVQRGLKDVAVEMMQQNLNSISEEEWKTTYGEKTKTEKLNEYKKLLNSIEIAVNTSKKANPYPVGTKEYYQYKELLNLESYTRFSLMRDTERISNYQYNPRIKQLSKFVDAELIEEGKKQLINRIKELEDTIKSREELLSPDYEVSNPEKLKDEVKRLKKIKDNYQSFLDELNTNDKSKYTEQLDKLIRNFDYEYSEDLPIKTQEDINKMLQEASDYNSLENRMKYNLEILRNIELGKGDQVVNKLKKEAQELQKEKEEIESKKTIDTQFINNRQVLLLNGEEVLGFDGGVTVDTLEQLKAKINEIISKNPNIEQSENIKAILSGVTQEAPVEEEESPVETETAKLVKVGYVKPNLLLYYDNGEFLLEPYSNTKDSIDKIESIVNNKYPGVKFEKPKKVKEKKIQTTTNKIDLPIGKILNTEYEIKLDGVYWQGKKLNNPNDETYNKLIEKHILNRKKYDFLEQNNNKEVNINGKTGILRKINNYRYELETISTIYEYTFEEINSYNIQENVKYKITNISENNVTVNNVKYIINNDNKGNIISLIPENNKNQKIKNEKLIISVEIERNKLEIKNVDKEVISNISVILKQNNYENVNNLLESIYNFNYTDVIDIALEKLYNNESLNDNEKLQLGLWLQDAFDRLSKLFNRNNSDLENEILLNAYDNLEIILSLLYNKSIKNTTKNYKDEKTNNVGKAEISDTSQRIKNLDKEKFSTEDSKDIIFKENLKRYNDELIALEKAQKIQEEKVLNKKNDSNLVDKQRDVLNLTKVEQIELNSTEEKKADIEYENKIINLLNNNNKLIIGISNNFFPKLTSQILGVENTQPIIQNNLISLAEKKILGKDIKLEVGEEMDNIDGVPGNYSKFGTVEIRTEEKVKPVYLDGNLVGFITPKVEYKFSEVTTKISDTLAQINDEKQKLYNSKYITLSNVKTQFYKDRRRDVKTKVSEIGFSKFKIEDSLFEFPYVFIDKQTDDIVISWKNVKKNKHNDTFYQKIKNDFEQWKNNEGKDLIATSKYFIAVQTGSNKTNFLIANLEEVESEFYNNLFDIVDEFKDKDLSTELEKDFTVKLRDLADEYSFSNVSNYFDELAGVGSKDKTPDIKIFPKTSKGKFIGLAVQVNKERVEIVKKGQGYSVGNYKYNSLKEALNSTLPFKVMNQKEAGEELDTEFFINNAITNHEKFVFDEQNFYLAPLNVSQEEVSEPIEQVEIISEKTPEEIIMKEESENFTIKIKDDNGIYVDIIVSPSTPNAYKFLSDRLEFRKSKGEESLSKVDIQAFEKMIAKHEEREKLLSPTERTLNIKDKCFV